MPEPKLKVSADVARATEVAFANYSRVLRRYLSKRIRKPDSVKDLTQEIFERFLQLPRADTARDTQAYLFGIASHVVSEFSYQENRSRVTFDSDAVEASSNVIENASPDDAAERLALQQDLERALSKLPKMQRAVLLLVKRNGFTYEEVAKETGLSAETVRVYVYEARATVKMLLKKQG